MKIYWNDQNLTVSLMHFDFIEIGSALGPFPSGTLATLECVHGISHGPSLAACDNGSWIPPEMGLCSLAQFENSSSNP